MNPKSCNFLYYALRKPKALITLFSPLPKLYSLILTPCPLDERVTRFLDFALDKRLECLGEVRRVLCVHILDTLETLEGRLAPRQ